MAACSTCGEPIVWARTETSHKSIPLDPDARDDGNIIIVNRLRDRTPVVRILAATELAPPPAIRRYVSHFATCPNAAAHKKGK